MAGETVGLIGLGLMGTALAERLLAAGFEVLGRDVDTERGRALHQLGGRPAANAAQVAESCKRIVLIETMAYSRILDTKGQKMIELDFATQARLSQHLKDVRLILEAAEAEGQELPLSAVHRQLLESAEAAGFGEADNSAIIEAYS